MLEEAIRHKYDHLAAELRAKVTFSEVMTQVRSRPDLVANAYRDVIPHMRGLVRALTPSLRAKMTELFGRMIGILSLTETPTNQAMWAHYSDSHKGFLLAFDTSNPFFHGGRPGIGEFHYLRRVQYKDRTDGGSSLVQLTGADVFLTKASDWAYEREWRMIAPLGNNPENPPGDDEVVLFDFPPHALIEVVVGARSTPDFRANLSRLVLGDAALAHIKLKEAFVSDQDAAIGIRVLDI